MKPSKSSFFNKEIASSGIPPQEFCMAPGVKIQAAAAQSFPTWPRPSGSQISPKQNNGIIYIGKDL